MESPALQSSLGRHIRLQSSFDESSHLAWGHLRWGVHATATAAHRCRYASTRDVSDSEAPRRRSFLPVARGLGLSCSYRKFTTKGRPESRRPQYSLAIDA